MSKTITFRIKTFVDGKEQLTTATKLAEKQIQLEDNYAKRRELWKSSGKRTNIKIKCIIHR